MIAMDLDGTLVGEDLTFSARTLTAIEVLKQRGCRPVLATGRMFRSARPFAEQLDLDTPLIAYQGALLQDPRTNEVLWQRAFEPDVAMAIVEDLARPGLAINVYVGDELYVMGTSVALDYYLALARVPVTYVSDLREVLTRGRTCKIVATGPLAPLEALEARLARDFGAAVVVTVSQHGFLECIPGGAGKGAALDVLAARLGIGRGEIIAVGDGLNDLDMIAYAGLGVAMGNAHPLLLKQARRIAPALAEDGFARLVDDLVSERLL